MPELVEIKQPNLKDVPESLRRLADAIEKGVVNNAEAAVIVTSSTDGEVSVYGYGDVGDRATCIGILHLGMADLTLNDDHKTP